MTLQTYNDILEYLKSLIRNTVWENHLYAVGGCVRDEFLGREINDVDLAVDLPDGGVKFATWLLKYRKTTGKPVFFRKFGTARIRLRRFPDQEIELVQTRAEKYSDHSSRCPEVVSGDIKDDCFRRDFTVNTLYRNISTGEVLDITGRAFQDMREGVLRTPLDPYETFDDDPVRILRCLRFAARFNWRVDPAVMEALRKSVGRLTIVSRERWNAEFTKMLLGRNVRKSLGVLNEIGGLRLMNQTMFEMSVKIPYPGCPTLLESAVEAVASLDDEGVDDPVMRFAAFFGNIGMLRTGVVDRNGELRYPRHEHTGALMAKRILRRMRVGENLAHEVGEIMRKKGDERMRLEKQRRMERHLETQKCQQEAKRRKKQEKAKRHRAMLAEHARKRCDKFVDSLAVFQQNVED